MPPSPSIRERTLSLATIMLTEKCFPMSRRKSRKLTGAVQSALSTSRAGLAGLEVEQARELPLDAGDIVGELLPRQQIALGGLARRIADHAGGAAGQCDGVVAGELEAPQHELAHEVPDMEAVAGRVEAAVERDRPAASRWPRPSRSVQSAINSRQVRSSRRFMMTGQVIVAEGRCGQGEFFHEAHGFHDSMHIFGTAGPGRGVCQIMCLLEGGPRTQFCHGIAGVEKTKSRAMLQGRRAQPTITF